MLAHPALTERNPAEFDTIVDAARPVVFRGLVAGWPSVHAGCSSPEQLRSYLQRFESTMAVQTLVAPPHARGRYFYADDMQGFNFEPAYMRLSEATALILAEGQKSDGRGIYVGSTPTRQVLPGFERENDLPLLRGKPAEQRIWLGNQSIVAAHFDASNNVACVVAGRRRFTLFPPEQVANLYIGPIDQTPAGPPCSMVDLRNPDFHRFPRFREALATATVADLEPGDGIYIPALWWHNVEALDAFNVLINYWWQDSPPDAGPAMACIGHGIMAISHLPEAQREAWRALFDHYVFRRNGDPAAHIPPHARGVLGENTPALRQRIKQFLLRVISS
jgi:hypothetical protein